MYAEQLQWKGCTTGQSTRKKSKLAGYRFLRGTAQKPSPRFLEHVMNPHWNQWIAFGWLFFFVIFLGLDAAAWISGDRRIPTFSRVVTHVLPWWVVLPLCCVLFVHFLLIYAERASARP